MRNLRRPYLAYPLLFGALLVVVPMGWAQTASTGAITGVVTDPSNAAIADARVVATNSSTGLARNAQTTADGTYIVTLIPPGDYTLSVEKTGFKTYLLKNVTVLVTQTTTINVKLQLGQVASTVEVSLTAPVLLQTASAALGEVTGETAMNELPLSNRNFTQLLLLSPGVNASTVDAGQLGKNNQDVSANGQRTSDNNFEFNGIDANNVSENSAVGFGPEVGLAVPAPDTIAEFKVQTGIYDATSGRDAGANVDLVTKSGTNHWHGDAWEFFRNRDLDANTFFLNNVGQPRPVLNQNQYGFTIGGPIRKNKTFIFGSYQRTDQKNGLSSLGLATAFLPPLTSTRTAAALGTQFGGETGAEGGVAVATDGSNINPVALALLNTKLPNGNYVIPNPQTILPSGIGESVYSIPAAFIENQYTVSMDHAVKTNNELSGRFFYSEEPQTGAFALDGSNVPGFGQTESDKNVLLVLTDTHTISSTVLNEASFGFTRFNGARTVQTPVVTRRTDPGL